MTTLTKLDGMQSALIRAETPAQCANLIAQAQSVLDYAKRIKLSLEECNNLARFRIECMRKAGEMLAATVKAHRPGKLSQRSTLPDDVTRDDSSRWQRLARADEAAVEQYISQMQHEGGEVTVAGLLRHLGDEGRTAKRAKLFAPTKAPETCASELDWFVDQAAKPEAAVRFGCVYADPPWRYDNQKTRGATDNHYTTMSVDEICALPVREIAADDAHLHLWTTNAFLFDARRVMEAWGFTYKSCFVWVKDKIGTGNYWRVAHEFLLLGTRGDANTFPDTERNLRSWGQYPRGRHSSKPDAIREVLERVSPGPRIELFARERFEGWSAWGNQVESSLFYPREGDASCA